MNPSPMAQSPLKRGDLLGQFHWGRWGSVGVELGFIGVIGVSTPMRTTVGVEDLKSAEENLSVAF
jgi:hypothetical protein